jgi:hypothetical protein
MFTFLRGLVGDRRKPYASRTEKFAANFPGEVTRQFFGFLEDDGKSPGSVVYSSKSRDGIIYDVRVTRVLGYFGSSEGFLETTLAEMARSMTECKILRQRNDSFLGCPAIAFEASIRDIMFLCGIVALHGKTLYIVSALFRSGATLDLPRFLDGFQTVQ